jgi:methylthioribose-1-phosphate isomerase
VTSGGHAHQPPRTLRWESGPPGQLVLIDQTRLPERFVELPVRTVDELVDALQRLAVRGAPAIGVAAGYGVLLGLSGHEDCEPSEAVARVREAAATLVKARPTAVNLAWAAQRMVRRADRLLGEGARGRAFFEALLEEAHGIASEDDAQCRKMGEVGVALLRDGVSVLTHCNAGALATGGMGTALSPIYVAAERGLRVRVFATETRPLLQGARLTSWELERSGIEVTLIPDSAAATVLQRGMVDLVLVGADRIARNGDVCNKIGTYPIALAAQRHGIPFYVVAPLSTFDPDTAEGAQIPIEERSSDEVTGFHGQRTAPDGVRAFNPAFDVTPAAMVRGIVTEEGLIAGGDEARIAALLGRQ